jgi:enolase-phosphatase E1
VTVALGSLGVRGVVLDIEGTTTPISFVYDVLFPYARTHLGDFLTTHGATGLLGEVDRQLREEHAADVARGDSPPPLPADVSGGNAIDLEPYVLWLMDRDRKSPGLKLLQGMIWQRGFSDGTLRGELFPDVAPALERWREQSIDVAIYSSGSVLAQRLIFGHTPAGDLTPRINQFFDATIGPKRSADSYRHIASELRHAPSHLLFLSDVHAELSAARAAGFQTMLCVRPGNPEPPREDETTVRTFDDIVA